MICVAATTLLSLAAPAPNRRELSQTEIAGYLPSTDVCDENALDLDQFNFKQAIFAAAYPEAENIYTRG